MPEADLGDHVDKIRQMWKKEWPRLDTSPFGIVGRLGRLTTYLDAHVEEKLSRFELTRESWDILASLRRSGPPYRLSPTELYRGLMRTSGAVTFRLRRLEKAGLIIRMGNPTDHRGMFVELTPKGLELTNTVAPSLMKAESNLVSMLTHEEQKQLATLMRKMLSYFESSESSPPIKKEWWHRGRLP